jgi:hypothetical protein
VDRKIVVDVGNMGGATPRYKLCSVIYNGEYSENFSHRPDGTPSTHRDWRRQSS